MDIARPDIARRRRRKRIALSLAGLLAVVLVTIGLSRLQPAAPLVENPWKDTVKRGDIPRNVRGPGSLLPEEIRWIPTVTQGRVESILVLPGAEVKANTVLIELSNPEVVQAAFDAEWKLKGGEAELANLKVQLETQQLTRQAAVASAEANYSSARLEAEVNSVLAKDGLVPALTVKQSKSKADELAKLLELEEQRLKIGPEATRAQLAVMEATVEQLRAQLELRRNQVEALKIRAGMDGVLQRLGDTAMLQVGQQLGPGANVARVADPSRLKAEIRIGEVQARDVQFGQLAEIDLRNAKVMGRVVRIDPSAQNGTRAVDVKLEGPLPRGAVPDLSVDGTIELEVLTNVLYVGVPVGGRSESTVGLFKVVDAGKGAVRVPVKLGRNSVSYIEIIEGLEVGDLVILSDMSQFDAYSRVRLN